jgi:hypothetical protein
MKFKLLLFHLTNLFLIQSIAFPSSINKIDSIYSEFSGKIYLLTVGIDTCKVGEFAPLTYSKSDANKFEEYLLNDKSISIKNYRIRDNSTKMQFKDILNKIGNQATKNDLFIFYYSGIGSRGNIFLQNDSIGYSEFYQLTQSIFCERQLIILDCNEGGIFKKGLINEIKKKPLEKLHSGIDRVLFFTSGLALDGIKNACDTNSYGSLFTSSLINTGFKLSEFFDDRNDFILTKIKYTIYNCMRKSLENEISDTNSIPIFIDFFSEKDFLNDFLIKDFYSSRGKKLYSTKYSGNNIIKRGETLCIILANQNFEDVDYLPNVMNDALKIEEILKTKYFTKTILLRDISYQNFIDTMNYIYDNFEFEKGSQLLFYAASHGCKDKFNVGYLIFRDSKLKNLEPSSCEMQNLKRKITGLGATSSLMLIDCCFSGSAFSTENCNAPNPEDTIPKNHQFYLNEFGPKNHLYDNFLNEPVNLFYCSSKKNQTSADGIAGKNSPFATSIINFLEENKLSIIESLYLQLKISKEKYTNGGFSIPDFCIYNCKNTKESKFFFIKK